VHVDPTWNLISDDGITSGLPQEEISAELRRHVSRRIADSAYQKDLANEDPQKFLLGEHSEIGAIFKVTATAKANGIMDAEEADKSGAAVGYQWPRPDGNTEWETSTNRVHG